MMCPLSNLADDDVVESANLGAALESFVFNAE
jgi:hypothetical protein